MPGNRTRLSTHWSKAGEAGSMLGMKTLLLTYRIFGRHVFRIILYPVMAYYYWIRKDEREASQEYLKKVKPFLDQDQQNSLSPFQLFMNFGEQLLDKFLVWMGQIGRDDVVFETQGILDKIDNLGYDKGGVIIVSHLGNTEVCNALAHQLPNIRLTLLVYTQHAEKYNSLIKKSKDSARIEILQVTDMSPATAMILSDRIDDGEYIVIGGDRTPIAGKGRVSDVTFLGDTAPMPQGAFIVASLLKCPVYLMFCLKQKGRYHIYVELFSQQLKFNRKERHIAINDVVQGYASRLEYYCLKAPMQWFNFFPFWREKSQEINDDRS